MTKQGLITYSLTVFILTAGLLIFAMLYLQQCKRTKYAEKEVTSLVSALNDSIQHFKTKDSFNAATISVIQTESIKAFTKLELMDDELKKLQAVVNDYKNQLKAGSSVTRALIETVAKLTGKPDISIAKGDTIYGKDSIAYIYPTYRDTIINKWISSTNLMSKDTAIHEIKINNEFSAIVGVNKGKPFVDLITENPYSTVKSLRTYQVKLPKPKKWGIGINFGYGVGTDFKPQPFIGIGGQYNIFRL